MSDLLTIGVVTYNGRSRLPATLASLEAELADGVEAIIADDGSDDGTADWIAERFPAVRVLRSGAHTGRPNRLRNRLLETARTPYVLLTDDDVVFAPGALGTLVDEIAASPDILAVTPRLLIRSEPDRIYMDGGGLHYLCVSTGGRRDALMAEAPADGPYPTIGCGIMVVNRRLAAELGNFDPGYRFGWGDDGELHVKGRLRGLRCLHVPSAVAYHERPAHGNRRAYAQICNRYRLLATAYSGRSLLLLLPPLLLFEIALAATALAGGFAGARLRAMARVLAEGRDILRQRRRIQALRLRRDSDIFDTDAVLLPPGLARRPRLARWAARANPVFDGYYRRVRRWL